MSQTLAGRWQTRVLLAATAGLVWTAVVVPVLARLVAVPVAGAYRMAFVGLTLLTAAGLGWEAAYHALQQFRWDKDWPSMLGILTIVNEAPAAWLLAHAIGVVSGPVTGFSPVMALFAGHVVTTWVVMWLFGQGPVRVLHPRWRFEGGQVLPDGLLGRLVPPVPGLPRLAGTVPGGEAGEAVVLAADPAPPAGAGPAPTGGTAGQPRGELVAGTACGSGHFNHPRARYCLHCGCQLPAGGRGSVQAPRPPLGTLVGEDGTAYVLEADLAVIEESPFASLRVIGIAKHPPAPVRVEIKLAGWEPVACSQGRFLGLALPSGEYRMIEPGAEVPVLPGSELLIGSHWLRYESYHQLPDPGFRGTARPDPGRPAAAGDQAGRDLPSGDLPGRPVPSRVASAALTAAALAALAAAALLALRTIFAVAGADPRNAGVATVSHLASPLAYGLQHLFTAGDPATRAFAGYGLAVVGYVVAAWILAVVRDALAGRRPNQR